MLFSYFWEKLIYEDSPSYFLIFLCFTLTFGQELLGNWKWIENSEERSFRVTLFNDQDKSKSLIKGIHCGEYYNGGRVDCASTVSIILKPEKLPNRWSGSIKSNFSGETSEIRVTYIPHKGQLSWEIKKALGQFYFPYDAILIKENSL
ncbi:hypothetical protein JYB62_12115 [Algoriphagus lutimaris]|uniref:hypothetical protein n=1 Tax=Algoriphagus lutimaris TaxID=613197 RepID=UPI00196B5A6B|nr:hypothetical protein [Algoriphagus lutimaris]MBN3520744.1 hypothetical protein [Algoriphagus lutimaris]